MPTLPPILTATMQQLGKKYPGLWRRIDQRREQHKDSLFFCGASDVFHAMGSEYSLDELAAAVQKKRGAPLKVMKDLVRISVLAPWRTGMGVYRFDPSLYQAITSTPMEGDLPTELLTRLPEWGIYIELQNAMFGEHKLLGAVVCHEESRSMRGEIGISMLLVREDHDFYPTDQRTST